MVFVWKFIFLIALCLLTILSAPAADDDDDMPVMTRKNHSKTFFRKYAGARDEQTLEVQASLSQPTRNPDGSATLPDDEEPRGTEPETD